MNSLEALAWKNSGSPASLKTKAGRALQIFQHYNLLRIARRGANTVPRKLFPNKLIGPLPALNCALRGNEDAVRLAKIVSDHATQHPSHKKCDLNLGTFTLLNHSVDLGNPEQWERSLLHEQPHLWRFQLHYHEFLLCQAADRNWPAVQTFLTHWLLKFAPEVTLKRDDAWHPYCLSRRIVAWTWLLYLSEQRARQGESSLGTKLTKQLLVSLSSQANYLSNNLERDLGGNHLLENAAALAILGGSTECPRSSAWISTATNILAAELPRQILPHGEHFELAPMYHCQMLGALLRIKTCCNQYSRLVALLDQYIDPMLKFIVSIVHPDGEIPLFADSGFHEAPSIGELLTVAELNRHTEFESSESGNFDVGDYHIFHSGDIYTIADFGDLAANGLPAHGHCDAFNLEMSVAGQRWIVDSGNFNYENDSMRHYCRSSIGHNVATIDAQNQANIWSKFRMGTRPKITPCGEGKLCDWTWRSASHNGYQRQGVGLLQRVLASAEDSMICLDIACQRNLISASRQLSGFLHFHPSVNIEPAASAEGKHEFLLSFKSTRKKLVVIASSVDVETGWYCEEFGKRQSTNALQYSSPLESELIGWVFLKPGAKCDVASLAGRSSIKIDSLSEFNWPLTDRMAGETRASHFAS